MINWKFQYNAKPQGSSNGFWYNITSGGYIEPELLLRDGKQLKKLEDAIKIVQSFKQALEDNKLLNEF